MMNLHALRLFTAVAEQRSFTRAAATVHVSQPAISKAVNGLERRLGVRLLERGSRPVRLTPAGAVLYDHARVLFARERAAEEALRALAGLEQGTLRVGASTTIATYMLPSLLGAFRRRHPGIELRLRSGNTQRVARWLRDYEVDAALVEGPVADARIRVKPWREDELVVIAAAESALGRDGPVATAALAEELVLVREPGSGTREVTETALRSAGVVLGRTLELGSTEAMKQGVAAGLGVAIVSRAAVADMLALGKIRVVPMRDLEIRRGLSRLELVGHEPSAVEAAFARILAAESAQS